MGGLVLFLIAFVPGVFWVWFFNRKDRYEKEPLSLLIRTFIYGMLSVIPAGFYESLFRTSLAGPTPPLERFTTALLVVGVGEELAKFGAFWLATRNREAFNEPMDGIVYAVTAALGFASVENLLYAQTFGLSVAPTRAVVTMLAHASFTGLVGYAAGMVHMGRRPVARLWTALATAALFHALYDFFVMARGVSPYFALFGVFVLYRFLAMKIAAAQAESPFRPRGGN
ncbi:MAG TPA: PrsW family glutamic-type intramembrane protease [Limnochordia bacterium]|nr:PrsW family glutamic-type intramembrane protease [Limnochordia bacterium]